MDGQLVMNQIMSGESARSPSQKIATFQNRKKKSETNLFYNSLSANPTKWSNTLKQFVGNSRRIV